MFLKLMDANADTIETHFALGSLYRRRGEVERAIRIHQNLLARAELPSEHREQALLALARDYLRAGVLDRAERLLQQVSEVPRLRASALDALRGVYERQHDWQQALGVYRQLQLIRRRRRPTWRPITCANSPPPHSITAIARRRAPCCARRARNCRLFPAPRCCEPRLHGAMAMRRLRPGCCAKRSTKLR